MEPGSPCAAVPPEVSAWVAAGRDVLAIADRADEWDGAVRRLVLGELDRVDRLAAVVRGKVLTAESDAGTWSLRGDRDLAGFVGRELRQGRSAGLAAVGQAGTLAAMPTVAEALVDGPVTTRHVAEITRATAASAALATELATGAGQAQVVELASQLDGTEFGKALQQMSAALDPATRQRTHDEQREARSFAWTHTPGGTLVKGRLDSVAGHKLAKVIDALCPRPALDDERTREQRQADALLAMVEKVAGDKATTPGAVAPVQAVITFTQETWAALRAMREAAAEPARVPGSALDVAARLQGEAAATDETGQAWPASEIARALCDCALTWAMVGTPGADLDLGRESRCFRRQHWMALYAAGITTCSIGACSMPLAHTELHHLRWWQEHGGATDIANCLPYCSFHHHEIHRLGIEVIRRADGTVEHRYPDGRPYGAGGHGSPTSTCRRGVAPASGRVGDRAVAALDHPRRAAADGPPCAAEGDPRPAAADHPPLVAADRPPFAALDDRSLAGAGDPPFAAGVKAPVDRAPAASTGSDPPRDLLDLLTD